MNSTIKLPVSYPATLQDTQEPFYKHLAYVNEELHDADTYFNDGENDTAHDELRHAQYFID